MLRQLIMNPSVAHLNHEELKSCAQAITGFALGVLSNEAYKQTGRDLGVYPYFEELKKGPFNTQKYFLENFWRAMYAYIDGRTPEEAARDHEVDLADIYFAIDMLSPNQIKQLQAGVSNYSVAYLNDEAISSLVQSMERYCAKLAWTKLRFIAKHDHSIDIEDLIAELQAEASRVIRYYSFLSGEPLKLSNYVRAAIENQAYKLIEFHTAKRRQRVKRTALGSANKMPQYQATTYSLDVELNDEGFNLYQIVPSGDTPEHSHQQAAFIEGLTNDLTENMLEFVNMVLGQEFSQEFETWVAEKDLTVEELMGNHARLCRMVMQYLKLTPYEVRDALGIRLIDLGVHAAGGMYKHTLDQLNWAQSQIRKEMKATDDLGATFKKLRDDFPQLSKADFRELLDGDEAKVQLAQDIVAELCGLTACDVQAIVG